MVLIIPKEELLNLQYTPVKYKDEIAMMAVAPKGIVILFTALDEVRFIPWDEIVEFTAMAPAKKIEEESQKDTPEKKKGVREIPKPN